MAAKVVIKDLPHKTYSAPVFVQHTTKEDKLLKKNGKQYILSETWFVPGKLCPLFSGSKFEECVDGWFQVSNSEGVVLWFRVGPKIIQEIFKS